MVKILGRGKEKEQKEAEFKEDLMLQTNQPIPGVMQEEYLNSLGRSVYMVMDPDVIALVDKFAEKYPELNGVRIIISHLNRLSKINQKELRLAMLMLERNILLVKMHCRESTYNTELWMVLQALIDFCRKIQYDSLDGFKPRIVTEQIKIVKAELDKQKRKVLPF